MSIPASLIKGDTIAITATARKITQVEIQFAINWLIDLGYKVVLGSTIGKAHHQFAGTDIERAADFQSLLDNPTVKAIWCARGGYGTVRMIDLIDFSNLAKHPKWIIGYSDITVLHSHVHNLGMATMHAPMPLDIEIASAEAKQSLIKALKGEDYELTFPSVTNKKKGKTEGEAIGGNLSVLYSLCGSESGIETKGKILFLEDLDEYYYHIDRMLQNLKRNGLFKDLTGLVIGGMNSMHDNSIPFGYSLEDMILEITNEYSYPVIFNAPFGHIKDNRAVILGKKVRLLVGSEKVVISM